jgi:hypothetical protein
MFSKEKVYLSIILFLDIHSNKANYARKESVNLL